MLARSYKKPGLIDIDRYHAKFGDVGIKYMKRCLPDLKIPQQYRCESCIDGKIHMFGHKACTRRAYERTEYPPGTYIVTDHSGPSCPINCLEPGTRIFAYSGSWQLPTTCGSAQVQAS